MKQTLILGLALSVLAGCGGGTPSSHKRTVAHAPMPIASGPISDACLASGRSARTRKLCGCIQAIANQTLTSSQQSRAVLFYSNPQLAQNIRQSSSSSDERFWKAYRAYGERSERICR